MAEGDYVDALIGEYGTLIAEQTNGKYDESRIIKELADSADWTLSSAHELLRLADVYGAFMLRNALAIAVVLGKKDGAAGF
jgi:hypothetical protein